MRSSGAASSMTETCADPEPPAGPAEARQTAVRSTRRAPSGSVVQLASASYIVVALGAVTGPIMARALGPAGRGEVAAAYAFTGMAYLVLAAGVPQAIGSFVMQSPSREAQLLRTALLYSWALVPLSVGAGALVAIGPLAEASTAARFGSFVLVAKVPLGVYGACNENFLRARGDLRSISILRVAPILAMAVAVIGGGLFGVLSVSFVIGVSAVADVVAFVAQRRLAGVHPSGSVPFRPMFSFGIKNSAGDLAQFGNGKLDKVLVAPVLGAADLGYYAVAATVASLPGAFAQALGVRAFGDVGNAPDPDAKVDRTERVLRLSVLTTGLGCLVLAVTCVPLIRLAFGSDFDPAVMPALLLLPGVPFAAMANAGRSCSLALGRPGLSSAAQIAGLVITLPGLALLLPRYGVAGAAAVTSCSHGVVAATTVMLLRRDGVRNVVPRLKDLHELAGLTRLRLRSTLHRVHRRRTSSP